MTERINETQWPQSFGKGFYPKASAIGLINQPQRSMNLPLARPPEAPLGCALKAARKSRKVTQAALAASTRLDLATVRNLEGGRGTAASLVAMLTHLEHRFVAQPDDVSHGLWLAETRKTSGLSQQRLCERAGVSKPSVIQIEREQGRVSTLIAVMKALGLDMALRPEGEPATSTSSLLRRHFIEGDCIPAMSALDAGSIALVVTSPPYNIGKPYERKLSLEAYAAQAHAWCAELPRLLTREGALWINLGYTTLGSQHDAPVDLPLPSNPDQARPAFRAGDRLAVLGRHGCPTPLFATLRAVAMVGRQSETLQVRSRCHPRSATRLRSPQQPGW